MNNKVSHHLLSIHLRNQKGYTPRTTHTNQPTPACTRAASCTLHVYFGREPVPASNAPEHASSPVRRVQSPCPSEPRLSARPPASFSSLLLHRPSLTHSLTNEPARCLCTLHLTGVAISSCTQASLAFSSLPTRCEGDRSRRLHSTSAHPHLCVLPAHHLFSTACRLSPPATEPSDAHTTSSSHAHPSAARRLPHRSPCAYRIERPGAPGFMRCLSIRPSPPRVARSEQTLAGIEIKSVE
ncbi:hypothetical protein IWX92DRAFT_66408 [Phyllosticta citricarpa]